MYNHDISLWLAFDMWMIARMNGNRYSISTLHKLNSCIITYKSHRQGRYERVQGDIRTWPHYIYTQYCQIK